MTKTKELTKEEIEEMESMSREKDLKPAPTYKLSSMKLNGKDGDYTKTSVNSLGELKLDENQRAVLEPLGKEVKGTILRSRIMFTSSENEIEMFTNEADKGGKFSVLVKTLTEKGSMITWAFTGTAEEVKARYPEMKYIQVLYFLVPDTNEIVRFKIKGKSLGPLFAYFKEFSKDEHIWEYISEFGYKGGKNKWGTYKEVVIKRGKKVKDISVIQNALREVNDKIQNIEMYYAQKEELRAVGEDIPVIDNTLEAQADAVQGGQEEINVVKPPDTPKEGVDDGELDAKSLFEDSNSDPSDEELKKAGL